MKNLKLLVFLLSLFLYGDARFAATCALVKDHLKSARYVKQKKNGSGDSYNQKEMAPNRLAQEKSPYLLQHANNPVDWFPWGEEAFEKAHREDTPIFLSIGYSTCHWCHVMEKESFENYEVAKLLNEAFVCIKVDREERPDIDNLYMTVCQLMTGSGGWPLTIIMTPDKKPFFAATYIPKENRFGKAGLITLIPQIQKLWRDQRDDLMKTVGQITTVLKQISKDPNVESLHESILKTTYQELHQNFDENHGGFGNKPKFPSPHNLLFLLRYWNRNNEKEALEMVEKTLQNMHAGGLFDHIGFGFHRYSTDEKWLLPHFEKMLYDQAMLALAYTEAYQITKNKDYEIIAHKVFSYILRDMTAPDGGFYSAEDADSEGEEGKFYLWTEDEIKEVLGKDASLIIKTYNIQKDGNFTEEATDTKNNKNILYINKRIDMIANEPDISEQDFYSRLSKAREKLFEHREKRVHPHKDDKILTNWNGLMIAALAKGSRIFGEQKFIDAAQKSVDFILTKMRQSDGRLLHRYRDEEAAIMATLDDYAFFIWGLIELYETTFDVHYLQTALDLNKDLISYFWDDKYAGFYFTPDDGEDLIIRQKQSYDGAIPSGNSIALLNLIRLGKLTANPEFEEMASKMVHLFASRIKQSPTAYTQFLIALDFIIGPTYEVVIVGNSKEEDTKKMLQALTKHFIPNKVVILRPQEIKSPMIDNLTGYTKNHTSINGKATAYVCANFNCKSPTTDINEMLILLNVGNTIQSDHQAGVE